MGSTVFDTSFAANRFNQVDKFLGLKQFKPTDVGLPSYLDEFCSTHGGCTLPTINIGGYQGIGGGLSATAIRPRTSRGSRRLRRSRGAHAARRHRRPARPARSHRRRQPLGPAHLRSHLHAAVQRREHADAEQPRTGAGRLRAGPADLGVDQRRTAIDLQQLLDGGLRPGHLAARPRHAQRRPPVRVRDRRARSRTAT